MLEGTQVTLTGFGSFAPKYSKPRVMTSGLTGKDYEVPAGMTMKFVVSPAFQETLKSKFSERKNHE
jgi:nucleoid DNA-binding protein